MGETYRGADRILELAIYIHTVKIEGLDLYTQFGLPQLHQKVVLHHGTVVESL